MNTDNRARKSEHSESEAVGDSGHSHQYAVRSYLFIMSPFFSKFKIRSNLSTNFSKNSQYNFIKIVWLVQAEGRTNRRTDIKKLILIILFVKAPKNWFVALVAN